MEAEDERVEGSQAAEEMEGQEEYASEAQSVSQGGAEAEDDVLKNNHDLIGVQGILRAQKAEINKIKVSDFETIFILKRFTITNFSL